MPALRESPGQAGHAPITGGPSTPSTNQSPVPGAPGQGQRLVPTFQLQLWACEQNNHHRSTLTLSAWLLPTPWRAARHSHRHLHPFALGCHACSLTWQAMPVWPLLPFPLGCGSWGTSRPDTPAYSFSRRCMGVTLRTWAPLPRMRQPGCGCRRGTRPGPAAPPSCWSTARAAVPPVAVRVSGTRVWVSTALRRHSLDTAAHPATVVRVGFLCCHGTPAPRTMPPARRAAGTQWPEIAGHAAGTGGPQPLYLGPCQGGCAGGRCMPSGAVCDCAQSAGCDSWTQQCSCSRQYQQCWVSAAGCEHFCCCQPGSAISVCPSLRHPALNLPLCPQSAPCSASGSSSPRWVRTGFSSYCWGWSWHWSAGPWISPSPRASKVSSGYQWVPGPW